MRNAQNDRSGVKSASLLRRRSLGSSRNFRGGGRLRDEPKERVRGRIEKCKKDKIP